MNILYTYNLEIHTFIHRQQPIWIFYFNALPMAYHEMFNNFCVSKAHGQNNHIFIIFSHCRNSFLFPTMFFYGYLCMITIGVRTVLNPQEAKFNSFPLRSDRIRGSALELIKLRTMQSFCPRLAACCFVRFSLNYNCYEKIK